jgi:hypothetical protein
VSAGRGLPPGWAPPVAWLKSGRAPADARRVAWSCLPGGSECRSLPQRPRPGLQLLSGLCLGLLRPMDPSLVSHSHCRDAGCGGGPRGRGVCATREERYAAGSSLATSGRLLCADLLGSRGRRATQPNPPRILEFRAVGTLHLPKRARIPKDPKIVPKKPVCAHR